MTGGELSYCTLDEALSTVVAKSNAETVVISENASNEASVSQ